MRLIPNIRRKGQASESPPKRKMSKLAKGEERAAYLFLSPWIIGFIVLLAGPIIASEYLSMNECRWCPPLNGSGWDITKRWSTTANSLSP